jgi:hypothetical protein
MRVTPGPPCERRVTPLKGRKRIFSAYTPGATSTVSPVWSAPFESAGWIAVNGLACEPFPGGGAFTSTYHVVCAEAAMANRPADRDEKASLRMKPSIGGLRWGG